jgi:hypothetical protein
MFDRTRLARLNEKAAMTDSRQLAGLIGPTMVAIGATEASNMDIFSNQIAPVVYLNGTILFVAGLAIVRAHNLWTWRWPVMLTLTGWVALIAGLWRMAAPNALQASENALTLCGVGDDCCDRRHSERHCLWSESLLGTQAL